LLALLAAKQAEDERLTRAWQARHEHVRRASVEAAEALRSAASDLGQQQSSAASLHPHGLASPAPSEPAHLTATTDVGLGSIVGWSTDRTLPPLSGGGHTSHTSPSLAGPSDPAERRRSSGASASSDSWAGAGRPVDDHLTGGPPKLHLSPASPSGSSSVVRLPSLATALREVSTRPDAGQSVARHSDPDQTPFAPDWSFAAFAVGRPLPRPVNVALKETLSSMPERRRAPSLFPPTPAAPGSIASSSSTRASIPFAPVNPIAGPSRSTSGDPLQSANLQTSLPSLASLLNDSPAVRLPFAGDSILPMLAQVEAGQGQTGPVGSPVEHVARRTLEPLWSLPPDPHRSRSDEGADDGGREGSAGGKRPRLDPQ
jgi:hypothetical protein